MNLTEVFKKIEMALAPTEDVAPEIQEKIEMATMKLANGIVLEAESFEAGQNVFLIGEDDEKVAAPVGEHELEDGRILCIEEEGVIYEIKDAAEEVTETEEPVAEEESTEMAEEMEYVSKEEFTAAMTEIKEMIAAMMPKEEQSAEEVVEEVVEEKVEMSEVPAAKKVTAAPVEKKPQVQNFSKSGRGTTLARIYSKLS